MKTITVKTAALCGVDARPIEVRVTASAGIPRFQVVGLSDAQARETHVRVLSALRSVGYVPASAVTASIASNGAPLPAGALDLPIALGVLAATGALDGEILALSGVVAAGELALDGALRPLRGALPIALACQGADVIVPAESAREAALAPGATVYGAASLREAVHHLQGAPIARVKPDALVTRLEAPVLPDAWSYADRDRFASAIEAGKSALLIGTPGTGKTLAARAAVGMLRVPNEVEALQLASIRSAAGLPVTGARPFRAPHHTISVTGLVGGGSPVRPGEVTLAHGGVLYLDELPEFSRHALLFVGQAYVCGEVVAGGRHGHVRMPSRFQLVASANPCPCGYARSQAKRCVCAPGEVERYRARFMPWAERLGMVVIDITEG